MVALSRCLAPLAVLLVGAHSARVARQRVAGTKFIAGVPVLNYDAAYGGQGVLGELETDREEEWVVVVKEGTSDQEIADMCKHSSKGCNLVGNPSQGGTPFLELRGTEKDLESVIQSGQGTVQYVEPDQEIYMIPEVEEATESLGEEDVQVQAATWGLNKVGVDATSRKGAGTFIYILDTGVRVSHGDFTSRAVPALDMTGGWEKKCNGDMTCAGDAQGHGTHCAGSAGGKKYGVAPQAKIRSIKVLSDSGSGRLSWSFSGLNFIATGSSRPAVASMSLGSAGTHYAMKNAVDSAVQAGVTVVVAAGNENSNACQFSPAYVPSAITVGSIDKYNRRSSFSNYGSCTDIWAPGSNIESASHTSNWGSRTLSGTSMACPHVSGGAATILGAFPDKQPAGVIKILLQKAKVGLITGLKSGDVNKLLYVGER